MNKAIGVDLGGTNLKSAVITESGQVENLRYDATEGRKGPKQVVQNLHDAIARQIDAEGIENIAGIGIGCAGQVDINNGVVYDPPNLPGWHKENLREVINGAFNLPTFVDNDANVAALAEAVLGAGKDSENMLLVTLGTGVGGGLILKREIFHGAIGVAGEVGHIIIQFDGPLCNCGQKGCVERFVGAQWIVERAQKHLPGYPQSSLQDADVISPKLIAQAAQAGDDLAIRILREVGFYLGIALGSVINLLNLDLIVIGGGISQSGPVLLEAIEQSVQTHAMSVPRSMVRITPAQMGENAGVLGAGYLVFDTLARRQ